MDLEEIKQHIEQFATPTLCQHGYHPKMCKFASPGKPCK